MRLLVNEIEVNTNEELREALKWENQRGEYAVIKYIAGPEDDTDSIQGLNWYGSGDGYYTATYTMRNWYNENEECTDPYYMEAYGCYVRSLSEGKSYEWNVNKIAKQMKKDGIELKK